MPSRRELVVRIQTLSAAEREWQPTAEDWLREQDRVAREKSGTGPGGKRRTDAAKPTRTPKAPEH